MSKLSIHNQLIKKKTHVRKKLPSTRAKLERQSYILKSFFYEKFILKLIMQEILIYWSRKL